MIELERITKQMMMQIDRASYEEISRFVSERGVLIATLGQISITNEQRELYVQRVRNLLSFDSAILQRANQLKNEARVEISKMSTAKTVKTAYDGPGYGTNSMFFDSRN